MLPHLPSAHTRTPSLKYHQQSPTSWGMHSNLKSHRQQGQPATYVRIMCCDEFHSKQGPNCKNSQLKQIQLMLPLPCCALDTGGVNAAMSGGCWLQMVLGASSQDVISPGVFTTEPEKGWFKLATFGTASQGLFGARFEVCAKQTFYQKTATINWASQGPCKITQNIPHDGITHVCNLTMEIACL